MPDRNNPLPGFAVALGLIVGGWFVGNGFHKGKMADRYVTVKGLLERTVEADIAMWPIRFVATDDNLSSAQTTIRQSHTRVLSFLEKHGISRELVDVQKLDVNDQAANPYRTGPIQSRYIIAQTVMVRSEEPLKVMQASQDIGALVDEGVVLSPRGDWESGPTFLFTNLTDLKPEMLAEATENARVAAQQFAQDSGSDIGRIRKANQGVFVILPRDPAPGITEESQLHKTVRVVATIEYFLD